jgi:diguanylate cyclase (GGDEF)-like protein
LELLTDERRLSLPAEAQKNPNVAIQRRALRDASGWSVAGDIACLSARVAATFGSVAFARARDPATGSLHHPWPRFMILLRLLDRFGTVMTGIIVVVASIAASVAATAVMMVLWFGGMNATAMALSALVPAVCAPLFVTLELRLVVQLRAAREEMRRLSIVDPLSGAYNRRHLVALVEQQVQRALRYGEPFSVVMLDVDRFKQVNDRHGHLAGDYVIRAVVECCRGALRDTDVFARFGGDEFIALLPHTGAERAGETAERLRRTVAAANVRWAGARVPLTISTGVAEFAPPMAGMDDLLLAADRALMEAKHRQSPGPQPEAHSTTHLLSST